MTALEKIGALVKSRRKQMMLTQADLAGVCNTGVRFIVDLEKGKETVHMGKALHVIKMLGIKIKMDDVNV